MTGPSGRSIEVGSRRQVLEPRGRRLGQDQEKGQSGEKSIKQEAGRLEEEPGDRSMEQEA